MRDVVALGAPDDVTDDAVRRALVSAEAESFTRRMSGLDAQLGQQCRITVVVSHRAWTLREMDRIYVLDDGGVVQQGRYDELLAIEHGRFAQLFADQSKS
ncbi:hypothetical protein ACQPXM_17080 [Kribbella sp. CA-253562]|uniref:hypothetical protein n=1 Tax=Kribbella sp. CA-253562 TaxID=3239942 RepID=UPI003D931D2A